MNKSLIALMALAASAAHAANDVPGNCGNGNGSGNACLPGSSSPSNNRQVNRVTNVNTAISNSSSRATARSTANARSTSSVGNVAGGSVGSISPSNNASNAGNTVNQNYDAPVSTAYAAPLTATNGTCMGSTSGGLSFPNFGISGGSTWNDAHCNRRYNATMLSALGYEGAAIAMMCQDPDVKAAMKAAGTVCPESPKVQPKADESTDPFIRRRLGLAPIEQ